MSPSYHEFLLRPIDQGRVVLVGVLVDELFLSCLTASIS